MKNAITGRTSIEIDAPVSKVWEAITNPQIIKQYFFGTNVISDWKVGNPIIFKGEWNGKSYQDKGTILNIIPLKLLRYNYWSSMSGIEDKPENYVIVTYNLFEDGDITLLTVIQENIPDQKMKEHAEENWRMVLNELKGLLERKTVTTL